MCQPKRYVMVVVLPDIAAAAAAAAAVKLSVVTVEAIVSDCIYVRTYG